MALTKRLTMKPGMPGRARAFLLMTLALSMALLSGCDAVRSTSGVYGPEPATPVPAFGAEAVFGWEPPKSATQRPEYRLESSEIPEDMPGLKRLPPQPLASREVIEAFTDLDETIYRIGPGDEFSFLVRGREDISQQNVIVSPDGMVALPRIGLIKIQGMALSEATESIRKTLQTYYENPEVTLLMRQYRNNRVFMLGQISRPGVVNLPGSATLLEAIALAGGVVKDSAGNSPPVNRCIIGRGKDKIIWLDLDDLLERGNITLNARLKNGDMVFIPQGQNVVAYVMGQVRQPGPLLLRTPMTVLDAITRTGGLTPDGDPSRVYLVRPDGGKTIVHEIDINLWVESGDLRKNFTLREGDLIYVAERGVSRFQYYLTRLLPSLTVIDFAGTAGSRFGQ